MRITFRAIVIAALLFGAGMGVAFGAGIAVGHGNQKSAPQTLTAAQLGLGGTGTGATGAGAGAGADRTGANGGAVSILANSAVGKITAVSGQSLTIETRQGSEKVNFTPQTVISKIVQGTATDLTEGAEIIASGTRNTDGSFDATSISQVPQELAGLLGGSATNGGTGGGRQQGSPSAGTPTPSR